MEGQGNVKGKALRTQAGGEPKAQTEEEGLGQSSGDLGKPSVCLCVLGKEGKEWAWGQCGAGEAEGRENRILSAKKQIWATVLASHKALRNPLYHRRELF